MRTFFTSIFSIGLFITILGYIFTGSDFSQAKPEVVKNKLGYYSIQIKTWYNRILYFDFNQMEEKTFYALPKLHGKGFTLFTKDEKLIESALIWIDYRQALEKERQLLASSKNEKFNFNNLD